MQVDSTIAPPTLDLAELARINRGDRVRVERVSDSTQELFEQTLALVPHEAPERAAQRAREFIDPDSGFIPQSEDLRALYLLAEAVGGYEIFHDLVNVHSPGNTLIRDFEEKTRVQALSDTEVQRLRDFQASIHDALRNANAYLRESAATRFTRDELHELHEVILTASERAKVLNRIMGVHLLHEIERAVEQLHRFHGKIRSVEKTIDGIFLVDSEVMFISTNDLVRCVNVLFESVGNSYLAEHVDGVLLLAARNLLIEVASFFSYYGKHQIYSLFKKGGATVSAQLVTVRIRHEIRRLFEACQQDNKLVLTRVMKDAEREFDISVEAITREAEHSAVEAVQLLIPNESEAKPPPPRRGLFARVLGWLFRR